VSGGADSTALLVALNRLRREFDLGLHAAHLHHGLRGAEADRDLESVRELCRRLGLPLTVERWRTPARMRRRGLSGEAGLRRLRREFLRSVARRVGAAAIATAHTADDQLETLVMRLLRGSGLRGLGGMRERHGAWIKPLLGATRQAIESDLVACHLNWREDRTNAGLDRLRSRVRYGVVPALIAAAMPETAPDAARAAGARAALALRACASATELRDAERLIVGRARRLLDSAAAADARGTAIGIAALRHAPLAVQRAALRAAWSRARPHAPARREARVRGLTARHLTTLGGLIARGRAGARADLPAGRVAEVRSGRLWIGPGRHARPAHATRERPAIVDAGPHRPADGRAVAADGKLARRAASGGVPTPALRQHSNPRGGS
jgi:tRNA(Ile)-lysidine synthase